MASNMYFADRYVKSKLERGCRSFNSGFYRVSFFIAASVATPAL